MNAKSEETKNIASDAASARGEGSCCGGSARKAAPEVQTRPRSDAEQQPDAIRLLLQRGMRCPDDLR